MAKMNIDEEGLLDEPCLSCEKAYVEDIWQEWCCDEKECLVIEKKELVRETAGKGGRMNEHCGNCKSFKRLKVFDETGGFKDSYCCAVWEDTLYETTENDMCEMWEVKDEESTNTSE